MWHPVFNQFANFGQGQGHDGPLQLPGVEPGARGRLVARGEVERAADEAGPIKGVGGTSLAWRTP